MENPRKSALVPLLGLLALILVLQTVCAFPWRQSESRRFSSEKEHVADDFKFYNDTPSANTSLTDEEIETLLKEFWNATDGPNWSPLRWNFEGAWDTWPGLSREADGISIEMFANRISGTLPNSFAFLPWVYVGLSSNHLRGTLPESICSATSIESLILSNNALTGQLPNCLGNLTKLFSFSLPQNDLSGTIPTSLYNCTELNFLVLNGNRLEGTIDSEIRKLKELQSLDLSNNNFSGTLPDAMGEMTSLSQLLLSNNSFSGTLTRTLLKPLGERLSKFMIANNEFSGPLYNISYLLGASVVIVSKNQFTAPLMEIGRMAKIVYLDMSYNLINSSLKPADLLLFTVSDLAYLNVMGNAIRPSNKVDLEKFPLSFSGITQLKTSSANWTCKTISTRGQELTLLVDPSFLDYEHCACIRGFFGNPPNHCFPCPANADYCSDGTDLQIPPAMYPYSSSGAIELKKFENGVKFNDFEVKFNQNNQKSFKNQPVFFEPCFSRSGCSSQCVIRISKPTEDSSTSQSFYPYQIPSVRAPKANCGCNSGFSGRKCSQCVCEPDQSICYYASIGTCRKCKAIWSTGKSLSIGIVLVVSLFVLATLAHLKMLQSKRKLEIRKFEEMNVFKRAIYRILHVRTIGYFKVLLIWLQSLSAVVSWPSAALYGIAAVLEATNGNPAGIGSTCLWTALRLPTVSFLAKVLLPLIIIIILSSSIFIANLLWTRLCRFETKSSSLQDEDSTSETQSLLSSGELRIEKEDSVDGYVDENIQTSLSDSESEDMRFKLLATDSQVHGNRVGKFAIRRYFSARGLVASEIIAILYFFYFGVTLSSLSFFTCESQLGTMRKYLYNYPWLACDSAQTQSLRNLSIPFLVLYTGGVPLLFIAILYYYRKKIHLRVVNDIIGGLYRCYTHKCFWWDIVVLFRRLALALAIRIPNQSAFHIWCVLLVLALSTLAQFWFQPFNRKGENRAEEVSLLLLILTFAAQNSTDVLQLHANALLWLSVAVNAIFGIVIIALIVRAWWTTPVSLDSDE